MEQGGFVHGTDSAVPAWEAIMRYIALVRSSTDLAIAAGGSAIPLRSGRNRQSTAGWQFGDVELCVMVRSK
jgi:hypothetical protein